MNFIITSLSSDLSPCEVCADGLGRTSSEPGRCLLLSAGGRVWPRAPRLPPQLPQRSCAFVAEKPMKCTTVLYKKPSNTCSDENSSPTLGYSPDRLHDVHQLTCHRKNYISGKKRRKNRTQASCFDLMDCVVPKFTPHHSPCPPSSGPAQSHPGRRRAHPPWGFGFWLQQLQPRGLLSCRTLTSMSPNSRKHKK